MASFVRQRYADLGTVDGLRGLFSVGLTATILTTFEIVFFYLVVAPGVVSKMDSSIKGVAKEIANIPGARNMHEALDRAPTSGYIADARGASFDFLRTMKIRSQQTKRKVNAYTKATGALIIGALVLGLVGIHGAIRRRGASLGTAPVYTALLTVALLTGFQYWFYLIGQEYKYPGAYGNEELKLIIEDQMREDVGEAEEES